MVSLGCKSDSVEQNYENFLCTFYPGLTKLKNIGWEGTRALVDGNFLFGFGELCCRNFPINQHLHSQ